MKMRRILLLLAIMAAGMVILAFLLIKFGGATWRTIQAVNFWEFCVYLVAQLLLTAGLAYCWLLLLPKGRSQPPLWLLIWGRTLRDAAGEFLPFSYAGGMVIGARAVALFGVPAADAAASTIIDVLLESIAEIGFMALGLVFLAYIKPETRVWLETGALTLIASAIIGFAVLARTRWSITLIPGGLRKITGPAMRRFGLLKSAFDEIRAKRLQISLATITHFVCAVFGGFITWFGFRILGEPISLFGAFAFEALIHVLLVAGFFVPGRIGVQEAAYLLLGTVFGVPPELAISLSLMRRARNFVISLPILLSWQFLEARRLAVQPAKSNTKI